MLFRKPLYELTEKMPEWEVRLWAEYLCREPGPDEKIEYAVTQLSSLYINHHKSRGKKATSIADLMMFKDVWRYKPNSGNDDVDHDIQLLMTAFATRLIVKRS